MKNPLMFILAWVVAMVLIGAGGYHLLKKVGESNHEPPTIQASEVVINTSLIYLAQVNGLRSGEVPNNDLERQRREQYRESLQQLILNRYGVGPYQIVLATNGQQRLVLDYPAMNYRLTRY